MLVLGLLLALQEPAAVRPVFRGPAFSFPLPAEGHVLHETANGQVCFVELRRAGRLEETPWLKLFSLPNQAGAVSRETLLEMGASEFDQVGALASLVPIGSAEVSMPAAGGTAAGRERSYAAAAEQPASRHGRVLVFQTEPMAAGALLWYAPEEAEELLAEAGRILAGLEVLPFAEDGVRAMERRGIGFALPILWSQQEQGLVDAFVIACQGPRGSVFVSGGQPYFCGGHDGEALVLSSQELEVSQLATNLNATIRRRDGLMTLAGDAVRPGQRYLLDLPDGGQAEYRNAVFSSAGLDLFLIGGLYAMPNREPMTALLARMMDAVVLPDAVPPAGELVAIREFRAAIPRGLGRSAWTGERGEHGWTFFVLHDETEAARGFELRLWSEPASEPALAPQDALQKSLEELAARFEGAELRDAAPGSGSVFGMEAQVRAATLALDGAEFDAEARLAAGPRGLHRSLSLYPADLRAEHRPVRDYLLARCAPAEADGAHPLGIPARIEIPAGDWTLEERRNLAGRTARLSSGEDTTVFWQELDPEREAAELAAEIAALAQEEDLYFLEEMERVIGTESVELAPAGAPATVLACTYADPDAGLELLLIHAGFRAAGADWHLRAQAPVARRAELLAAINAFRFRPADAPAGTR